MSERRKLWNMELMLKFLNFALVTTVALSLISFFALVKTLTAAEHSLMWRINLVLLQLCFTGGISAFLFTVFFLVQRALGPLSRIEAILDKVIQGDFKQRVSVREKDMLFSLITKVNQIIGLLDSKTNK